MLITAALFGLAPALLLFVLAVVERARSVQRVASPGARFSPAEGATVLHDALLLNADRKAVAAALIDLAVQRKVRLLVDADAATTGRSHRRAPVGMEVVDGATFTSEELSVLEALFGPDHTPGRVRRLVRMPGPCTAGCAVSSMRRRSGSRPRGSSTGVDAGGPRS